MIHLTKLENIPGPKISQVHSIVVDQSSGYYLSDELNHRILKITSDGRCTLCFGKHGYDEFGFWYPRGLLIKNERLYVCDSWNNRIQVFDLEGHFVKSLGKFGSGAEEFNEPVDIKSDEKDNIWVADRNNHRLKKYDPDFNIIECIGTRGSHREEITVLHSIEWKKTLGLKLTERFSQQNYFKLEFINQVFFSGNDFAVSDNERIFLYSGQQRVLAKPIQNVFIRRGLCLRNNLIFYIDELSKSLFCSTRNGMIINIYPLPSNFCGLFISEIGAFLFDSKTILKMEISELSYDDETIKNIISKKATGHIDVEDFYTSHIFNNLESIQKSVSEELQNSLKRNEIIQKYGFLFNADTSFNFDAKSLSLQDNVDISEMFADLLKMQMQDVQFLQKILQIFTLEEIHFHDSAEVEDLMIFPLSHPEKIENWFMNERSRTLIESIYATLTYLHRCTEITLTLIKQYSKTTEKLTIIFPGEIAELLDNLIHLYQFLWDETFNQYIKMKKESNQTEPSFEDLKSFVKINIKNLVMEQIKRGIDQIVSLYLKIQDGNLSDQQEHPEEILHDFLDFAHKHKLLLNEFFFNKHFRKNITCNINQILQDPMELTKKRIAQNDLIVLELLDKLLDIFGHIVNSSRELRDSNQQQNIIIKNIHSKLLILLHQEQLIRQDAFCTHGLKFPDFWHTYFGIYLFLLNLGIPERGYLYLSNLPLDEENFEWVSHHRGLYYLNKKEYHESLQEFFKEQTRYPKWENLLQIANVYKELQEYEKALEFYAHLQDKEWVNYHMGLIYIQLKNEAKAMYHFLKEESLFNKQLAKSLISVKCCRSN